MIILIFEASIKVNNFKVENEFILFIDQISTEIIKRLARRFKIRFTLKEREIYSFKFHLSDDLFLKYMIYYQYI